VEVVVVVVVVVVHKGAVVDAGLTVVVDGGGADVSTNRSKFGDPFRGSFTTPAVA